VGQSEITLSRWGREGEGGGEGGEGEGGPLKGVASENHIKLTTCSTEYRIQTTAAAKLMCIKLPMYLLFIWCLDLMAFLGPNGMHLLRSLLFLGPKKS
jgi:hypothetical protein